MKIALITPFPPYRGGISTHSKNLYDILSLENEVVVYNFSRQYPNFLFPGKTQYDNSPIFEDSHIIRALDSINPLTWKKVANSIIKNKFDKVIFRFWNPFFIFSYISIIKRLKKHNNIEVYSICDNIIPHEKMIFGQLLTKFFLDRLDGIIVMSSSTEKEILHLDKAYNYKKIYLPMINDLGKPLNCSISKKQIGLNQDKKVFLFFGLIREYKGLDILLHAINRLDLDLFSKSEFLIVGESYQNIDKYKNILDKDKKSSVKWITKYIPDDNINLFFSAADYVVLPYKRASQSGVIPMAYYFGKPVITSKIDGLEEIVINGSTGYTFDILDINNLANILENCIKNKINIDIEKIKNFKNKLSTENFVKELVSFINE